MDQKEPPGNFLAWAPSDRRFYTAGPPRGITYVAPPLDPQFRTRAQAREAEAREAEEAALAQARRALIEQAMAAQLRAAGRNVLTHTAPPFRRTVLAHWAQWVIDAGPQLARADHPTLNLIELAR
jgi:hypothetical protein